MPNTRSGASRTREGINEQIDRRLAGALGARDAARNLEPLIGGGGEQEEISGNRGNGNGNGNGKGNGYNLGGFVHVAREYTYQDFLKCQPLSFNGTEGVVGLTRWFEKMEMVFHISNCPEKYQVKMVPNEEDKVERFVGGLPDNIQGNVIAVEPTKLQDAIRIGNNLMDQKLKGYARSAENKRRLENNPRDNQTRLETRMETRLKTRLEVTKLQQGLMPLEEEEKTPIPTSSRVRSFSINVMLLCCTLGLLGHSFDIDLMPVELGSFDVIIGMDWLAKYHALIICDEKVVRIPYGDEVLIIRGDDCDGGSKSRLNIISCTKTQKYIQKGCQVYLVQVTSKKTKDKSEEKRLEDVPIVREFPKVFPEDLSGLPPARQVKFQIDLVHDAALVARVPYRLAPAEMQELST
ncbi:putative reverse transcriptase domain-containing protein [Tanacetum coccineum]